MALEKVNPQRVQAVNTLKVSLYDRLVLLSESQKTDADKEIFAALCRDPVVRERRPGTWAAESLNRPKYVQLDLPLE